MGTEFPKFIPYEGIAAPAREPSPQRTVAEALQGAERLRTAGQHREANVLSAQAISMLQRQPENGETFLAKALAHEGISFSLAALGEPERAKGEFKVAGKLKARAGQR